MDLQDWWDRLGTKEKKQMVSKYLSENRTINFITSKDIKVMYEGELKINNIN